MREAWTGEIVKRMHMAGISRVEVAKKVGVTKSYLGMILNGCRSTQSMEERVTAAVTALEKEHAAYQAGAAAGTVTALRMTAQEVAVSED